MTRYSLSDDARRDLKAIWRYVAADSRSAADRLIHGFDRVFDFLAANPLAGEATTIASGRTFRIFSRGRYVIYYTVRSRKVVIAHVRHGARDQP